MEGIAVYTKNGYFLTVGKVIGFNNIYKTTVLLKVIELLQEGRDQEPAIAHVRAAQETYKIEKRTADLLVAVLRRTNADLEADVFAIDQRTNRQRVMMERR